MHQLPHQLNFNIRTYEADFNNRLKINSLLNYMQEASAASANWLGFGYDQLQPLGKYWVLSRVIVEVYQPIGFDHEIIIETWPKSHEKLSALRDFNIIGPDKQVIGKATTLWIMIDEATARPVVLDTVHLGDHYADLPAAIARVPGKIPEPAEKSFIAERKIVYSDLDVNHHVNNAKYAEFLFDALPADWHKKFSPSLVQINFLRELKSADTVRIFASGISNTPGRIYAEGLNIENTKTFQAEILFNEIHNPENIA